MPIPIERISVCNLLSFGESAEPLELRPLNVLIGINGSGKSNLIETIALLASMNSPRGLSGYIGQSGGIFNWLWKGTEAVPIAKLDVSGGLLDGRHFEHQIAFTRVEQSIEAVDESVSVWPQGKRHPRKPLFSYEKGVPVVLGYEKGIPVVRPRGRARFLERSDINFTQSILWQDQLEEIANTLSPLSRLYRSFQIYRMGNIDPAKQPQRTDLSSDYLIRDGTNLSAVLSRLMQRKGFRRKLINKLNTFYSEFEDLRVIPEAGTQQIYFEEKDLYSSVPASRLSDGTIRWLSLLAILLDPDPPPLVCIEEPEIGLHPDIVVELAELLREASESMQLIVTTHSTTLVDSLTRAPEAVIVCEKVKGATKLRRLDANELKVWLENYSLGELWRSGQIGGNRW
jgi:predicted ATPase